MGIFSKMVPCLPRIARSKQREMDLNKTFIVTLKFPADDEMSRINKGLMLCHGHGPLKSRQGGPFVGEGQQGGNSRKQTKPNTSIDKAPQIQM